ncbi:MAG TPA: transcriptional repressor LexA [Armatimonadota bacterium]|nr:transcriptional repressor LexA [Armatimonadota bacterium]
MRKEMTPRQRQILHFILQHIESRGYPPTVREIGEAVNLSSSSTVHAHLRTLEQVGLIKRDAVLTRAIRLLPGTLTVAKTRRVVSIPVVGRVAAGKPTLAVEDFEEVFPLPQDILGGSDGFMLRVHGDSMIEDAIRDGDLVIVRRQEVADNGDTVVALIDNEATVKRFYREDGEIRLQPANSAMPPIFLNDVTIIGKVVGLVRRM